MSSDLIQITGEMPILAGKANFRQWFIGKIDPIS
jgi:hypothetical protein